MKTIQTLKSVAREGLAWLHAQPDMREAEVFVAANDQLLTRLNYTSEIPCNGVEEPKSTASFGLGLRIAWNNGEGIRTGFGSDLGDLSLHGLERAFHRAKLGAVLDPEFVSLPKPNGHQPIAQRLQDHRAMALADRDLVAAGWKTLEGALETFYTSEDLMAQAQGKDQVARLGLIVGGDVILLKERIAVASTHLPEVAGDESTAVLSSATAMVEHREAKGSGWSAVARWRDFDAGAGAEAARNAIRAMGGQRVPDGEYRVVFGPQPVTDLFHNLVIPSLQADSFYSAATPFLGKLGQTIAWEKLSVYDHGALPGLAGSKRITCEGLPTGRTDLVRGGQLVGLLSNYYESRRLLKDPNARQKLGIDPYVRPAALVARNGFRYLEGGGRHFGIPPRIAATNLFIEADEAAVSHQDLLRRVGDGLYIGRIWYTYPINGLARGDFTCTVVGDSYLIKDGTIQAPLKPNTVRITDNVHHILNSILGIGGKPRPTVVWAADQVVHAPEMAVSGVTVRQIAVGGL
ncbi:MAG: TldD/PmbA family protein [Chloroflexi bacterium]|nr:TldD/PmbA family protein [Chloroflexota bacterium]